MTIRYVGPGGSDSNSGLTWALRKLTLNGVEDTPIVAGDTVYVGPGVYRELLTLDVTASSGNRISYIGDVTGEHTDGVGGIIRITGSDDDETVTRTHFITTVYSGYRTWKGFNFDNFTGDVMRFATQDQLGIIIEDCVFHSGAETSSQLIEIINCDVSDLIIRNCTFLTPLAGNNRVGLGFFGSIQNDQNILIENCQFIGGDYAIQDNYYGGITINNCLFWNASTAIDVQSLDTGQNIDVNHCLFHFNSTALDAASSGQIVEDYNNFWANNVNRVNVSAGSNSIAVMNVFRPWLIRQGYKFERQMFELSQWSSLRQIAGNGSEATDDFYGITRPTTSSKRSWGPFQFVDSERETTITRGSSAASILLNDAGRIQIQVPVKAESTTISVYAYRESNYAGTLPQMVIKQPGQSDRTTTDTGSASQWNELSDTFTPDSGTDYVIVELVSNNTAASGSYRVAFDDLTVS